MFLMLSNICSYSLTLKILTLEGMIRLAGWMGHYRDCVEGSVSYKGANASALGFREGIYLYTSACRLGL